MANYNDLITAIDSVIKTNNRREITGQLLQNVLNTMVCSLGENYQLAGFATPTTNPHQPDQNVFYVASQAGVYTQFDNIVLGDGISFLMWKNGAWTSQTISMVTQSWVQQNYVSKEWFRKVFRVYDEDGLEIVPNDMDSVVDNIKAMVGLWTNEYLSALGMGRDGGGTTQTLAQLNDVQLGTLANGDALVYNTAIHKWENKQIQTGVDMSVVWAALAANTNEQINASHLATALSGYVTTEALGTALQNYATQSWVNQNFVTATALGTTLQNYATQAWVNQNFITVEWFDKLFQLYNGTEAVANKIAPNGALPVDQTQLNIEAMFGFWTKKYISALGKGDDGTTSYNTLAQLNDVTLTNPTANQILVYDGTHWRNQNQQSVYVLPVATTTILGGIKVGYTTSGKNYKVQLDASNNAYVNVPWTDTTYTLAGLMGSTAKGSTTQPIYWNGSEFANITYTLGAACAKGVTDNSSNADVTSSDTNLITGRTLYYQLAKKGYTTNTGTVTSVATGTGLTGGTITTSGTISINSTYQTYISHGESAYGWGNHANEGYLKVNTNGVLEVGQYIDFHKNGTTSDYSTRIVAPNDNGNVVNLPSSDGTLALTSDLGSYLPLSGGTMTGTISFNYNGSALSFMQGESLDQNGNVKLGAASSSWNVFTSSGGVLLRLVQGTTYCGIGIDNPQYKLHVNGNIATNDANGAFMQIGNIRLVYDSTNNAIKVIKSDGTNANLYATGGVSALGAGQESGGGGDVTWALLASPATGGRTIHSSYISSALSNYLPLSGGTMTGGNISWNSDSHGLYFYNGCGIEKWSGYGPSLVAEGNNLDFWISSGNDRSNNAKIIHSGNIGSQSVAYANSAGSVAWGNVSGRPSSMPASDVYAWAKASTKPSYTLDEVPDGSIRKLANYLPLSGGTMSGTINTTISSHDIIRAIDSVYSKYVFATSASGGEYAAIHGFNHSNYYTTGGSLNLTGGHGVSIGDWNNPTMFIQTSNGNVGIGTSSPTYKLTVEGAILASGDIDCYVFHGKALELSFSTPFIDFHYNNSTADFTSRIIENSAGTLTCQANLRAYSYANTSDIRLKNKIKDVEIPLEIIARAPAFQFTWKNPKMGGGYHLGTSAQYWQSCVSELVDIEKDEMGTLSMQYGVAALISAITVARKVMTHEEKIALLETRVSALEKENGEQEMLINSLQEELAKFKAA